MSRICNGVGLGDAAEFSVGRIMDSWSDEFFEMLDSFAGNVERFLDDVAKDVNEVMDAIVTVSEEAIGQVHATLTTEIERQFSELLDPWLDIFIGFESTIDEATQSFTQTIDPFLSERPACVGCRHYHGQVYGGNLLVCGMHPYGWEGEKCPDWQSPWQE